MMEANPTDRELTLSLICKLGSIVVHTQELLSPKGRTFDKTALEALINDDEVKEWIHKLEKHSLVPKKR